MKSPTYIVGATAFVRFRGYNRTKEKWQLNVQCYKVASKAVSKNRALRQQSMKQFLEEWVAALTKAQF